MMVLTLLKDDLLQNRLGSRPHPLSDPAKTPAKGAIYVILNIFLHRLAHSKALGYLKLARHSLVASGPQGGHFITCLQVAGCSGGIFPMRCPNNANNLKSLGGTCKVMDLIKKN